MWAYKMIYNRLQEILTTYMKFNEPVKYEIVSGKRSQQNVHTYYRNAWYDKWQRKFDLNDSGYRHYKALHKEPIASKLLVDITEIDWWHQLWAFI